MEAFKPPLSFGPFKLFAKIDKGGMAEVYLGVHTEKKEFSNELLAIKKLLPHLNSNRPFVNLLVHEAKIGVLLNHPSIASVYDLGSHKSEFFIALEYVHGKSLERLLRKLRESNALDLITPELSAYIVLEVLRALAFAHDLKDSHNRDLNIVHRDLSPGNILLSYRGEVKLTDFGIATAEHRLQSGFTHVALGKLVYLSPEQAVNDPVSRTSDLYSLGVVLYQLLTGRLPYHAENSQSTIRRLISGKCESPHEIRASISKKLSDLVMHSIARDSKKRFQNSAEFFKAVADHFQTELQIDFNSRTARAYYQKKLSELIKNQFKDEVPQESEILQRAIHSFMEQDEGKTSDSRNTMPQDEKALESFRKSQQRLKEYFGDSVDEKTIVLEDHADEATRMGNLNQEERNTFRSASGVRAAIAHGGGGGEGAKSITHRLSDFPRLTLNQKIKLSSLNREDKEILESQLPKIEINSQESLDAFEEETFPSGENSILQSEDSDHTRAMNRNEIIRSFEKYDKKTEISAPPPTSAPKNKKSSHKKADERTLAAGGPQQKLQMFTSIQIKKSLLRWKWLFSASLLLFIFAVICFFIGA